MKLPHKQKTFVKFSQQPIQRKIIQLTAVANGSMQHQVFLPERDCQSVAMCCVMSTVNANITSKKVRAVYTHCYGHALNIAVGDSVKRSKVMRDSLDTVFEMSKFTKY